MDLRDATRMILSEPAEHPEPLRVARHTHDEMVTALAREIDRQAPPRPR